MRAVHVAVYMENGFSGNLQRDPNYISLPLSHSLYLSLSLRHLDVECHEMEFGFYQYLNGKFVLLSFSKCGDILVRVPLCKDFCGEFEMSLPLCGLFM